MVARVETYVVRVWMPDRPGALGQVASRIGAVGGDVVGDGPDVAWLAAFVDGSRHLAATTGGASTPNDLAWGSLDSIDRVIAVGRSARPFHVRERRQLEMLCGIGSALATASVGGLRPVT